MEKAIDIKRRAQRCIQNGDLDGALNEYEKLVGSEDSDPYNYVLLADLLYKKGDHPGASERYLSAVGAYEHASLYKNAIAVCKKMMRLSLSPAKVLQSLGNLHALDGLSGEAALYYVQYAEHMVRSSAPAEAAHALRQAFDVCQDNLRVLEQLSEAWLLAGEKKKAGEALLEAADLYRQRGAEADARRCTDRAAQLESVTGAITGPAIAPASGTAEEGSPFAMARLPEPADSPAPSAAYLPEPGAVDLTHEGLQPSSRSGATVSAPPFELDRPLGFESGRHDAAPPAAAAAPQEPESRAEIPAVDPGEADDPAAGRHPAHDDVVIVGSGGDAGGEDGTGDEGPTAGELAHEDHVPAGAREADPVYEIADEDVISLDAPPAEADAGEAVYEIADEDVVPLDAPPAEADAGEAVYEFADEDVVSLDAPPAQAEAGGAVYEIAEDEVTSLDGLAGEEGSGEPVYEITEDEVVSLGAPSAEAHAGEPVYEISDDAPAAQGTTPEAPGLAFQAQAAVEPSARTAEEAALAEVEELLAGAQGQFRAGERDLASHTLTHAAQAYEALHRLDNAATIYRSLGRGAHATPEILELWLRNCERRHDALEAATVACDLGDRALNDGDENRARGWFERALSLDGDSETARRRLERLARKAAPSGVPVALAASASPQAEVAPAPAPQDRRVEVAVGRAEAVSFDLAGLLAEFQRGVEAQLAGDAQSHYDLGMTYREMGLHAQAIDSFRSAEQDPRFAARACEMTARCLAEQGRPAEAVGEFERALAMPGVGAGNDIELRYHFGNTLVELGRLEAALTEYESVAADMPEFEDVGCRLEALRRTLGRA